MLFDLFAWSKSYNNVHLICNDISVISVQQVNYLPCNTSPLVKCLCKVFLRARFDFTLHFTKPRRRLCRQLRQHFGIIIGSDWQVVNKRKSDIYWKGEYGMMYHSPATFAKCTAKKKKHRLEKFDRIEWHTSSKVNLKFRFSTRHLLLVNKSRHATKIVRWST